MTTRSSLNPFRDNFSKIDPLSLVSRVESRWVYNGYRKSVFAITFLESLRLAATCDGSVHVRCRSSRSTDRLVFNLT